LNILERGIIGIQSGDKQSVQEVLNLFKNENKNNNNLNNEVYLNELNQ